MKNLNYCWGFVLVFAMLFTSCSKEESGASVSDQDTVQLQLGALLNDFATRQANKAHETDPTECRDADPAYVKLGLTNDATGFFVGGPGNTDPFLIEVNIKNNNGSWETEYSDLLGLPAGDYTLEYFIVYSADDEVLWVAPRAGGDYASSVGSPLPMSIDLEAGTKPYIVVDVLCYIPRNEEAYGYIFFDIDLTTVENNYCIFVNYCYDGTGREYPAKFEVDIWADAYDGTDVVIDGDMNSVSGTGNSFAATVLCLALPPLEGDEVYYVRVRVLSAGAYTADASDFVQFTISQADIDGQLDLTPRYRHIRINCVDNPGGGDDCTSNGGDADGDGICDNIDDCINGVGSGCSPGGGDDCVSNGGDLDGDGICDNDDDCINGVGDGCDNGDGDDCDETVFIGSATDDNAIQFNELQNGPTRWGFIYNFVATGDVTIKTLDIYAGASTQYNLNDNTDIGDVTITYNRLTDEITVTFDFENANNELDSLHVNISEIIPGSQTLQAPGQYNNNIDEEVNDGDSFTFDWDGDNDFYIVIHGEGACKDGGSGN